MRTFVELVERYINPEFRPYPEYKGKPYYSIKYIENGEEYVGYSTYSLRVMSEFLKKYFISPALEKQEKDRWIPVTERLPEYEKEVLTCGDNGDISVGYLYFPGFGHADRWHVDFTSAPVFHIVAWRPLPEPYTEEEA